MSLVAALIESLRIRVKASKVAKPVSIQMASATVFLAFQSQAIHTDDHTGNPITTPQDEVPIIGGLRIVAANINPLGDDPGKETVTIINISPNAVDLTDWMLADKADKREALGVDLLGPGQCKQVVLSGRGAQLSNKGGRAPF